MASIKRFYPEVNNNLNFRDLENWVINFWNERHIFELSLEKNIDNNFVFFDGPPFANGLPHYGHLLAGYIKDTTARYQTMKGKRVLRRFGWDCHGLPAEQSAENALGIGGRAAIESYGIEKFNSYCREDVLKYANDWKKHVKRSGRWVDFDNGYRTMDLNYMESVLWVFKQLYDKGLLYEDYRVMPYSWKCQTPLSNMETRMDNSFRERADKAVTVKFKLEQIPRFVDELSATDNVYFLVWTTTPWTLPSNLAIAVNGGINYALIRSDDSYYIIGENAIGSYEKELADRDGRIKLVKILKGNDLVGIKYTPLFDYLRNIPGVRDSKCCFTVLQGDFVAADDGTCIVHVAPGFGEDDQVICRGAGIPTVCPVDDAGCFSEIISDYAGQQVFDTNEQLIARLKQKGSLLKTEQYLHNYPHCWRTDTPLIYRAMSSWFVDVPKIREKIIKNNENINWIPGHLKNGRFGKWLEGAREWSITRNRFWGCPIPVWKSDNSRYPRIDVYGSLDEIERDFAIRPKNLHRPFIDNLTRKNPDDPSGKSTMRRVPEVLDCWFESGAMPYAQLHYPFENKDYFEKNFPADFIAEGDGQLRGWFYTLLVLSTALFDVNPFKNCISFGTIIDESGKKLSKRLRNYVDPYEAFDTYGSDSVRWLMLKSPALGGAEFRIRKDGKDIGEAMRLALRPIVNSYSFFCLYANGSGVKAENILENDDIFVVKKGRGKKLVDDSKIIRNAVFVDEQKINAEEESDEYDFDQNTLHYVVYQKNEPIVTLRARICGTCLKPQRFCVLKKFRGRYVAKQLLKFFIVDSFSMEGIEKIEFDAQARLRSLYESMGFRTRGEEFEEAGLKHIQMFALIKDLKEKNYFYGNNFIDNVMDIYILSKLREVVEKIETSMDNYDFGSAGRESEKFFEVLNNWYIRRNKNRFWKSKNIVDRQNAYNVLYTVLLTMVKAIAPLAPFTTEYIWNGLNGTKQVL
ncbi:MAG: isoleucine--tRNA ligase [Rickettsiales bacterium]|jgi:isoleucyl-tRNA synthetase|nr:isoleucine--tRNA ligase [Rickettsiales bacterium]